LGRDELAGRGEHGMGRLDERLIELSSGAPRESLGPLLVAQERPSLAPRADELAACHVLLEARMRAILESDLDLPFRPTLSTSFTLLRGQAGCAALGTRSASTSPCVS